MNWLNVFKHLLPHGRAWSLTIDKNLRRFFSGLAASNDDAKTYVDQVWRDLPPATTRDLDGWETQFGLIASGLTTDERRSRLDGAWKALGGQDPHYIQQTLQNAGFDVYVHEWWEPGTESPVGDHTQTPARSPIRYVRRKYVENPTGVNCGEAFAECGEAAAECGNTFELPGYVLVNKILETVRQFIIQCGETAAQCGETAAQCGAFVEFADEYSGWVVPSDARYWPYFLYIGAPDIYDIATLPASRRDEFEALCLKICPAHLWLGILVQYT